ncbi:SAV_2336 N-terminal domain-related protein [Streptomyces sp. NRRL S-646]|uniref:SAV_2336 N-terminal domain-related protein n=1 Tax=Streptomyces sp. NRRL S-646 TaxID=1463917 RepID=UPI00068C0BD0|nr:SAV_2336 N-terminal domain-related protein [Streptomyces sp. NRRL S-646]
MTAPTTPPAADGPLAGLAERLRTRLGVEPGARELAEALWLAQHVGAPEVLPPVAESPADPPYDPPPLPVPRQPTPGTEPAVPAPEASDRTRLYAADPRPAPGGADLPDAGPDFVPVRVPMATALPHALGLQRALRPLQRYHPPVRTTAHRLDEQATAERAAETGLLTPVLRADGRREARMRLLMDASSSTSVWDSTLEELRQICAGLGAFREVQVHYVHLGADGKLALGTSREPARAPHAAEQLRDPTGRQLTLVLSDCAGPLWRSGQMQRLLHHWAQAAPVAVVQPLPQSLWRRTHLPALPGTLRRREGLGARLEFRPAEGGVPPGALPIPVLGPTRAALGTWSRLLSGGTGLSLPAAAAWVQAVHPAAQPRLQRPPAEPATLVAAFRRSASRQAVALAVSFSAVPLTLPVMQLVQRAMQPRSGPSVLAEVLLSGLVKLGEGEGWYEFVPGVREELLRLLPRGEALLVLKHSGEYVERHFGRRTHNFPALALARLTGGAAVLPEGEEGGPEAFAEVSRAVLGRFAGPAVVRPAVRRESYSVVCTLAEQPWARWTARVLEAAGHEVDLRMWRTEDELPGAVTPPSTAAPGQRHRMLVLIGDDYEPYETPLEDLVAQYEERVVAVDVTDGGAFLPWAVDLEPDLSLSGVTEGLARWRLLNHLAIGADAPLPDTRDAEFPGPTRFVQGPLPERSPGHVLQEGAIDRLRERLRDQREASVACALVGPRGTGKTQLAAEYVHRFGGEYDFVWWISADSRARRIAEVGRLAQELEDHPDRPYTLPRVHNLFRHLREANLRWLIVYDGWDDLEDANELLISGGHALITSRDAAWAEAVDALRLTDTGEGPSGPEAERDELVRRALVRVYAPSASQGVESGTGFFLAPGWVVTALDVVRGRDRSSTVGVAMMDGSRHQVEQVLGVGDLALLHVPRVTDADCMWLTDRPVARTGAVNLYRAEGSLYAPRVAPSFAMASGRLGRDTFALDGDPLPPGSAGGPVLDAGDGSVIGVVKSRRKDGTGEAVHIDALRGLCDQGVAGTELWHGLVRAHDRHHYDRRMQRGPHLTWTGVQMWLTGGLPKTIAPEFRTELYGLLAELEPPDGPQVVQGLLDDARLRADRPPRHWRDGAGCLHQRVVDDRLFLYAARVWALLAPRSRPDQATGLAALRRWLEGPARSRMAEDAWEDIATVFARVDTTFAENGPVVRVEIDHVGPGYGWRVVLRRGGEDAVLAEDMSGGPQHELQDRLRSHLADALLRADTAGVAATVHFCLPGLLLWDLPVEDWRLPQTYALGGERIVLVRHQARPGASPQERQRRWDAVSRGPLHGFRLISPAGESGDWTRTPPNAVPLLCRHADTVTPTAALDVVRALGYPLVLWSRAASHTDCTEFYERAEELLRQSGTARELIAQVGRLRLDSTTRRRREDAWARHLAVFCDPPEDR